jgi:hypothetical protein
LLGFFLLPKVWNKREELVEEDFEILQEEGMCPRERKEIR